MDKFQPHQQRVIDKLIKTPEHGVIAYHSLGSGKTLTALGAADAILKNSPRKKALFVVPASLRTNVYDELKKHRLNKLKNKIDVMSYERAANIAPELAKRHYALTVFDEAHRLRNKDTKRVTELKNVADKSDKLLLLTGTAGYNHPVDVMSLISIINPKERVPKTRSEFEGLYVDSKAWKLKNKDRLAKLLNRYIDKYDTPSNTSDFPSVTRKTIKVEMSPEQASMYKSVEKDIPAELRRKLKDNASMSLQEASRLNVFSQGVRQVSDSMAHHDISADYTSSPKMQVAAQHMISAAKNIPGFRGVAYSNYIDAGLVPYAKALEDHGIKPLVFTGKLNAKEKAELIDEYNSKSSKPKVLLLSSSGSEGINLKRTRLMQVLEPHFNASKIKQAEGRAIRFKSHEDLPESERNVIVENYQSTLPKTRWQKFWGLKANTSIDPYLADLSAKKQGIVDEMNKLLTSK